MHARNLLLLTLTSLALPTLADTVWLKNGDRLTGKISVLDGGKLLVETDYGGSIPVDWNKVRTLEADQLLLVEMHGSEDELARKLEAGDEGQVILNNGTGPRSVPLASISQIIHPKPLVQDFHWEGDVDVALDYKRAETDTDDYHVSFDTKAKHGSGGTMRAPNTTASTATA